MIKWDGRIYCSSSTQQQQQQLMPERFTHCVDTHKLVDCGRINAFTRQSLAVPGVSMKCVLTNEFMFYSIHQWRDVFSNVVNRHTELPRNAECGRLYNILYCVAQTAHRLSRPTTPCIQPCHRLSAQINHAVCWLYSVSAGVLLNILASLA